MIRLGLWVVAMVTTLVVLWQECGENAGVFCYRIGSSLFARVRPGELCPARAAEKAPFACSSSSEIFSTHCMMWKD